MKTHLLDLQDLLGRKVHDTNGRCAGRIEEVIARKHGGDYLVEEFHFGRQALLERLSVTGLSMTFLSFIGARRHPASHLATWEQLDLSDPSHPRLRCRTDDLKEL